MSAALLRRRFIDILVANHGHVAEADFRGLIGLARESGMSPRLRSTLLQPASFLRTSPELRDRRISLEDITFDDGALRAAKELAAELAIDDLFPGLPRATQPTRLRRQDAGQPGADESAAPQSAPVSAAPTSALQQALAAAKPLGPCESWRVTTAGSTLAFHVTAGGAKFPAVVFQLPDWQDPAPRDLVAEQRAALSGLASLDGLRAWVRDTVAQNRDYFEAQGVAVRGANQRFGIQHLRRSAFFAGVRQALVATALSVGDQKAALGDLHAAEEDLLCGRSYVMQVGEHTNYWPYWKNYLSPLHKLLAQTPVGSEAYLIIKNRIEDILNRKTVFNWNRHVDEQDFEVSISGVLVQRRSYSSGPGQRVSLAAGSRAQRPSYEVLNLADSGLPSEHAALAGLPVYRDGDGALCFDWQGPAVTPSRAGQPVPAELADCIVARKVTAQELGVRALVDGESARPGIPFDWNQDGGIELSPLEIGWWGHCHNEAPLNAMGVNPQRSVTLYRCERGDYLPQGSTAAGSRPALQTYSPEDCWDLAGALTADHESGWAVPDALRMKSTHVEVTQFVGSRNNGGHWLLIEPAGRRRIRVDAEVKELWHKSDPSKKYENPAARFRRDLPTAEGTFLPNPDWVSAEASDEDDITIDAKGRRLLLVVKYVTLNDDGERDLRIEAVELNPGEDSAVKIAEEVQDMHPSGCGGKVVEHWYNAKTGHYHNIVFEVSGSPATRRELTRSQPGPAARVLACQETVYDSVIEIHEFVTARMGLPFVFDTSSGMAVWNYPVSEIRIDKLGEVDCVEAGRRFRYSSYKLHYVTMGGPSGEARYIIKRDESGQAERAMALDPMPDFAFRQDRWVCAPAAADAQGRLAINVHAQQAGYLTDKGGTQIVPVLWQRQAALLYAALADDLAAEDGAVYLLETPDGQLFAFPTAAQFEAAVQADLAQAAPAP